MTAQEAIEIADVFRKKRGKGKYVCDGTRYSGSESPAVWIVYYHRESRKQKLNVVTDGDDGRFLVFVDTQSGKPSLAR